MSSVKTARILVVISMALICASSSTPAKTLAPNQQLARGIYQELVEINTVTPTGDTGKAAEAMAARLRAAAFPDADVQVFKPAPRKGNLMARLRGTGARELSNCNPVLSICGRHLYAHLFSERFNSEDSK